MISKDKKKVCVVGAGVIGLTTALVLMQDGYEDVILIAEYFPGDTSTFYTSPVAGARWKTLAPNSNPRLQRHDEVSFKFLWQIAKTKAKEAGIMIVSAFDYYQHQPTEEDLNPWWKSLVPAFQLVDKKELPESMSFGYSYATVTINPKIYLPWLLKQFVNLGGKCQKRKIFDLSEVMADDVDIVVNCTGIHARKLVDDKDVMPTRGHNVVVKAPHIRRSMTLAKSDSYTYVIPRSDGTVVLGTTKEENSMNTMIDENETQDILQRAVQCCPELSVRNGIQGLQIVDNLVGFRPARKGGPRIQNDYYVSPIGKQTLITHHYGHGGSGYQSSWGSSQEAVQWINQGYNAIENQRHEIKQLLCRL